MGTLRRWSGEFSIASLLYIGFTSGSSKLLEAVLGYEAPEQPRQLVNSRVRIGDLGNQVAP